MDSETDRNGAIERERSEQLGDSCASRKHPGPLIDSLVSAYASSAAELTLL
jgi:hypothetical protein